jgi:hypothetical protein
MITTYCCTGSLFHDVRLKILYIRMTLKLINFTKHYQKNHKKKYTVNAASNCV